MTEPQNHWHPQKASRAQRSSGACVGHTDSVWHYLWQSPGKNPGPQLPVLAPSTTHLLAQATFMPQGLWKRSTCSHFMPNQRPNYNKNIYILLSTIPFPSTTVTKSIRISYSLPIKVKSWYSTKLDYKLNTLYLHSRSAGSENFNSAQVPRNSQQETRHCEAGPMISCRTPGIAGGRVFILGLLL